MAVPDFAGSIEEEMEEFARRTGGVRALVVGDRSGLPVASLRAGRDVLAATAMATLALGSARSVARNLHLDGGPAYVVVAGNSSPWRVVVHALEGDFTLLAVVDRDVDPEAIAPLAARLGALVGALFGGGGRRTLRAPRRPAKGNGARLKARDVRTRGDRIAGLAKGDESFASIRDGASGTG